MKDFEYFLKKGIVKKQTVDKSRAKDLIDEANRKFNQLKRIVDNIGVDNEDANDIIEDSHDVILGLARAKMLLKGFKSSGYSAHEAKVAFLKILGFNEHEIEFTNKLRYFRNGILYYGTKFEKDFAEKVFAFLIKIKRRLEK